MRMRFALPVFAVAAATALFAAGPTIVDVKDAGPDYLVQGEYLGEAPVANGAMLKMGAQVAALGGGKFALTVLPGGLPGAGWDNQIKFEAEGKTEGAETTFAGQGFKASIAAGKLTMTRDDGKSVTLAKTVRVSPTLGAKAPDGALVLLTADPKPNIDAWNPGQVHENGWFTTDPNQPKTKANLGSGKLHIEVMLPFEPENRGQGRSNSGIYLQDRYEVQVVDSFGFKVGPGKPNGDVIGDIYSKAGALTNAALPPLCWQTYDIDFVAAKYENGQKTANARATVKINGILVHDNVEISACTGGNGHQESADPAPLMLQFHHHPIFFRNVWFVAAK
ncbi:MAG: DUF1080 domain-containing protein [Armatimonadetes bacterium]|nr:DUF1080 domain-containing protein [Armatimonadota bacterium]